MSQPKINKELMSAVVEDTRSNQGPVRRGAIKRKSTKENTSSVASDHGHDVDKISSRPYSFDEHRHPTGQDKAPSSRVGPRPDKVSDPAPTTFDEMLGKYVPLPEVESKTKKAARMISKLRF